MNELKQKLSLAEQDMTSLREAAKAKVHFEAKAAKVEQLEEEAVELKKAITLSPTAPTASPSLPGTAGRQVP